MTHLEKLEGTLTHLGKYNCRNAWEHKVQLVREIESEKERLRNMQKEFTKADLRTGDIVQYRSGALRKVMLNTDSDGDVVVGENGWCNLWEYDDNLLRMRRYDKPLDIVKVYRIVITRQDIPVNNLELRNRNVVWERQEPKPTVKISKDEAFKVLKEHYGASVEMTE